MNEHRFLDAEPTARVEVYANLSRALNARPRPCGLPCVVIGAAADGFAASSALRSTWQPRQPDRNMC